MKAICEELNIRHVFSPVYTPQANSRLEGWHHFLKACIAKHIPGTDLEWDKLVPLAVSAYNFFLCQSSRESPFVLMFGRDPITPIAKLLEPRPRYYGDKGGTLCMDTLRKLYMVTAENIRRAREKVPRKEVSSKLQVGDFVFVRDPDSDVFEPSYSPNYQIIAIHSSNRIEVQDEKGHGSVRRAGHVKRVEPVDKVCQQLPPEEVYKQYGRTTKLLLHPKDVPNINLVEEKEMINRKNKLENRRNGNVTLCELTEESSSDKKVEKLINTVISTKMVQHATKEECEDDKSSKEMINQLGNYSTKEGTEQWTTTKDHNYLSDYGKKSLNHLGGVMTHEVSFFEGERTGQWTIPKECMCPSDYCEKSLTHLEGVITGEVPLLEGEPTGQRTIPKGCMYPSNYGEKSLNRLEGVEGEGSYLHWTGIADNYEVYHDSNNITIKHLGFKPHYNLTYHVLQ